MINTTFSRLYHNITREFWVYLLNIIKRYRKKELKSSRFLIFNKKGEKKLNERRKLCCLSSDCEHLIVNFRFRFSVLLRCFLFFVSFFFFIYFVLLFLLFLSFFLFLPCRLRLRCLQSALECSVLCL